MLYFLINPWRAPQVRLLKERVSKVQPSQKHLTKRQIERLFHSFAPLTRTLSKFAGVGEPQVSSRRHFCLIDLQVQVSPNFDHIACVYYLITIVLEY